MSAPPGAVERRVARWRDGALDERADRIAEEVPVAFAYNGEPFAVMMATPSDLADFALGFSLSEGVIARADELSDIGIEQRLEGWEIALTIPAARAQALARRERTLEGRSGCGVCGSKRLDDLVRVPAPVAAEPRVTASALDRALATMAARQSLAAATGATHAAAWSTTDGDVELLREDVGRHNALDKLIGAIARANVDRDAGFAIVTSRASYELAMKAASAGIGILAAVSAPTALAISLADSANLTLIGFARPGGCAVYTHHRRYVGAPDGIRQGGNA